MHGRLLSIMCAIGAISLLPTAGLSTTRYEVRLGTDGRAGRHVRIAFDLVSDSDVADSLEIIDFRHNGTFGPMFQPGISLLEGGPTSGDLLNGLNPAATTTLGNTAFFNELLVPFDSLGANVAFAMQIPEVLPSAYGIPDEISCFFLTDSGSTWFNTSDPLGANALFSVSVTGEAGGDLSVFWPTVFVAPDTLVIGMQLLGVVPPTPTLGRLRFRSVIPNPAVGGVRFVYEVPEPGGFVRARIFDVSGRLIAEPYIGKRQVGIWTTQWDAADMKGRAAAPGVYLVQLEMGRQSIVRRVTLTR